MRRAYAYGRILAFALVVALAGCTSNPDAAETAASVEPSVAPAASPIPTEQAPAFPTQAFADMSEDAVSRKVAAEFQAALIDMAGGGGMAATVMSPDGTWSGATGKADGVRDVRIHDQFAIASVTKPVVAAQVMQMVEAGEPTIASRVLTIIGPTVITLWVLVLGVLLVRKCREAA